MSVNATGSDEIRVNTTTLDSQETAWVTVLADGGWVVTWQSTGQDGDRTGVYQQRFNADGTPSGSETLVNTVTGGNQKDASTTALSDGGWVATWVSEGQDGQGFGVYQQRFSADGALSGSETLVNAETASNQVKPYVTALADGGWLVTWTSSSQDGNGEGVFQRRFDADGATSGPDILVNSVTSGSQNDSAVATLSDGGWVVTWTSEGQDGSGTGIYQQQYDADGNTVGVETRVNTVLAGDQSGSDVTALADGGWVVTWTSAGQVNIEDVFQQRFDAAGNAVGPETLVNTETVGEQSDPSVTALADGGWVVVWQSEDQDGSGFGIYQQRYDAAGNPVGTETLVTVTTDGDQGQAAVSALPSGGWVVTWQSSGQDGSDDGVYQRVFAADVEGTSGADSLVGTAFDETMTGLAGNDTLDGKGGADILIGGQGNDIYGVDNAGDDVREAAGQGTDTVRASISYTLGDTLENLVLTGSAALAGTGNASDNTITGNAGKNTLKGLAGNDILNGGTGADRMEGGTGNDVYFVDNAGDVVVEGANAGTDTVRSSLALTLGGNLENLVLIGSGNIGGTGNGLNNTLTGNAGNNALSGAAGNDTLKGLDGNDTLNGGAGADRMEGGTGNDLYFVDNAGDLVVEAANAGIDTVQSSLSLTLGGNLENLVLTGSASINGTGNSLANSLTGNAGNNVLSGLAGNDTLKGLGGSDTLNGGTGADRMEGGTGNDLYFVDNAGDVVVEAANAGIDTAQSSVSLTLAANVENLVLTGSGNIAGIGNTLANSLTGNAGKNVLSGGSGNDTLKGLAGNDRMDGGAGADKLFGGAGADKLTGGTGADRFVFSALSDSKTAAGGRDTVLDFNHGQGDKIDLSALDAIAKSSGNQAFDFIGDAGFTGQAGELRFVTSKGDTFVHADTNGDGVADFSIAFDATIKFVKGDFLL